MDIGHKIYELRRQNGLTQEQFAEQFHVTRQTVSNWENSKNYPDMATLRQISETYGVSFDELLRSDQALIQRIDQTKKRAGRSRWLIILNALLLLILLLGFAVPRIASIIFYNPDKVVAEYKDREVTIEAGRMETDVSVYSELLLPCLNYNSVNSHNTGLGKYNVLIQQNAWISSAEQKQVGGSIDKGALTLFNPSGIARPVGNAFAWTINQHDISKSMAQTQKEMLEDHLKENPGETEEEVSFDVNLVGNPAHAAESLQALNDRDLQIGYIDFDHVMSWADALDFVQRYDLVNPWLGIVTSKEMQDVTGMYATPRNDFIPFDQQAYPYLFGSRILGTDADEYDLFQDETIAKQHFISLLQYLHDHNDFLVMMDAATGDFSEEVDYSGKIRYLKKHDLKVYGVATLADKNTLLKLLKDDDVYSIGTEPY